MILSQTDFGWLDVVSGLTASASFACLVWYFVVKHLPALDKRQAEERAEDAKRHEEERTRWLAYLEKRDDRLDAIANKFSDRIDACIAASRRRNREADGK